SSVTDPTETRLTIRPAPLRVAQQTGSESFLDLRAGPAGFRLRSLAGSKNSWMSDGMKGDPPRLPGDPHHPARWGSNRVDRAEHPGGRRPTSGIGPVAWVRSKPHQTGRSRRGISSDDHFRRLAPFPRFGDHPPAFGAADRNGNISATAIRPTG